jgi:hypothetical protein
MNARTIRVGILAVVTGLTASCAPVGGTGYDTYGNPVSSQPSGQDFATIAALGAAGLASYGYLKERSNRKELKRERKDHNNYYHDRGYRSGYGRDQYRGRGRGRGYGRY